MKSILFAFIFLLTSAPVMQSELAWPLAQSVSALRKKVSAGELVRSCMASAQQMTNKITLHTPVTDKTFETTTQVDYLNQKVPKNVGRMLKELKFGKRLLSVEIESTIDSEMSGILIKATIGVRSGNGIYEYVTSWGSSLCNMKQQKQSYTVRVCENVLFFFKECEDQIRYRPRGFTAQELSTTYDFILDMAATELSAKLGLKSNGLRAALGNVNSGEHDNLKQLYSDMHYNFMKLDNISKNDLIASIMDSSDGLLRDTSILSKINSVASVSSTSTFLVVPSNGVFFVITVINRTSDMDIKLRRITTKDKIPVNAFAYTAGAWNIEIRGKLAVPSIDDIVRYLHIDR